MNVSKGSQGQEREGYHENKPTTGKHIPEGVTGKQGKGMEDQYLT